MSPSGYTTRAETGKSLRFYNPFAGKPVPFKLSGLFLLDPATMMKLHGISMRRILTEDLGEAFYKKLERVSTGKQSASGSLGVEFLDRLPIDLPIGDELRAAVQGDIDAQERMESLGNWELHFLGAGEDLARMSGRGALLVSIERASSEPMRLIRQGAITDAVALMRADPVISAFLWPEVAGAMERCKTAQELLPAQAAIAVEVLLSYVAATDAELASADESTFACILPGPDAPGKNPTSLFVAHLLKAAGVTSLQALLDHPKAKQLSIDMTTLKRWSAGSHCPDPVWLMPVLKALFGDANYAPAKHRYWGARYLNLIGYFAQLTATKARRLVTMPEVASALSPWPNYPFGHSSCDAWMQARYPYWFKYHLDRRQLQPDGTREKRPMGLFY